MSNLIQEFLSKIVNEEVIHDDHWLLTDIFYPALPTKAHYKRFLDDPEGATFRMVVYDWWNEYLKDSVSNEFLRKYLEDSLYDEFIYEFLENINENYHEFIEKHYNEMFDMNDWNFEHELPGKNGRTIKFLSYKYNEGLKRYTAFYHSHDEIYFEVWNDGDRLEGGLTWKEAKEYVIEGDNE